MTSFRFISFEWTFFFTIFFILFTWEEWTIKGNINLILIKKNRFFFSYKSRSEFQILFQLVIVYNIIQHQKKLRRIHIQIFVSRPFRYLVIQPEKMSLKCIISGLEHWPALHILKLVQLKGKNGLNNV